jgi:hypothetical protein
MLADCWPNLLSAQLAVVAAGRSEAISDPHQVGFWIHIPGWVLDLHDVDAE